MHKEEIERKRRKGKNFILSFHAWNVTRAATLNKYSNNFSFIENTKLFLDTNDPGLPTSD